MATREAIQEKIDDINKELEYISKPLGRISEIFSPNAGPEKLEVPDDFEYSEEEIAFVGMMTCGDVRSAGEYPGKEDTGVYNSQHQNFMFATDHILGLSERMAIEENLQMLNSGRKRGLSNLIYYTTSHDAGSLGKSMRESFDIMMDSLTSRNTMDKHTAHYSKLLGKFLDFLDADKNKNIREAMGLTDEDIRNARGLTGLYDIYSRNLESRKALLANMLNGGTMSEEEKKNHKGYILLNMAMEKDMKDNYYQHINSDEYKRKEEEIANLTNTYAMITDEQERKNIMERINNENSMLGLKGYQPSDYMKISDTLSSGDISELPEGISEKIGDFVNNNSEETWLMADNEQENLKNLLSELNDSQKSYVFGMFKPSGSKYYNEVQNSLNELVKEIQKAKMNPESNARVVAAYAKVGTACEKYLEKRSGERSTSEGRHRQQVIKSVMEFCKKDYKNLSDLTAQDISRAAEKGKRYRDFISDARIETVQLPPDNEIDKVGGAVSQRLVIKNNEKGLDGFFTEPKYVYSFKNTADLTLEAFEGSAYRDVLEKLVTEMQNMEQEDRVEFFKNKKEGMPDRIGKYKLKETDSEWIFEAKGERLTIPKNEDSAYQVSLFWMSLNDYEMYNSDSDFGKRKEIQEYHIHRINGALKEGREISKRNVAMSRVATIMGMDDIIAKSKNMKVRKDDGTETEGVYMERAKGMSLSEVKDTVVYQMSMGVVLSCKNPDFKCILDESEKAFENGNFKLKLSDMNILDIVCGNSDRHSGNMTYTFKKTKDGYEISDVQGIDNDLSFGNTPRDENGNLMLWNRNRFDYIRCVRKSTADKINSLSKDMLKFILGDLIQEDEIESTWERVQDLKSYLENNRYLIKDDKEIMNDSFKNMFDSGTLEDPMIGTFIKKDMDKFGKWLNEDVKANLTPTDVYVRPEMENAEAELKEKVPGFKEFIETAQDKDKLMKIINGKENAKYRDNFMKTYRELYNYTCRENVMPAEKRLAAIKYMDAVSATINNITLTRGDINKVKNCLNPAELNIKNTLQYVSEQSLIAGNAVKGANEQQNAGKETLRDNIIKVIVSDYLDVSMGMSAKQISENDKYKEGMTDFERLLHREGRNILNKLGAMDVIKNKAEEIAADKNSVENFLNMSKEEHRKMCTDIIRNSVKSNEKKAEPENSHKKEVKQNMTKTM